MEGKDQDKTVFKQPVPGGERTSIRPSPGRRTGQIELDRRPTPQPARQTPSPNGGRGGYEMAKFSTAFGLNPLVNSASTLIAVFEKTRGSVRHPDVSGLHKRLIHEIRSFEQKAKNEAIKPEIILAARYLLCSIVDEAVLHTPWGGESAWAQRTLLTIFHNETSGGEKCFSILDRMLYRTIRTYRGDFERSLSTRWEGLGHGRKTLTQMLPIWVAASIFCLVVFAGYGGFTYWMRAVSNPVVDQLNVIAGQPQNITHRPKSPVNLPALK